MQGRLEEEIEFSAADDNWLHGRLAAIYMGPAFSLTRFWLHVVMIVKLPFDRVKRQTGVVGTVQVRLLKVLMAFLMAPAAARQGEVLHQQRIHLA